MPIEMPERNQAAKIRQALGREVQHLRNQRNLSREGMQAKIAAAYVRAQAKLAELRQAETQRLTERKDQLTKQLFGQTRPDDARILIIRDASDRAAKIAKVADMAKAMNRAEMLGDPILLKALAQECARRSNDPLQSGWGTLFQQWANAEYGANDAVEELGAIAAEGDSTHRMHRDHAFSVGALPAEVQTGNLKVLAEQADSIPELPPSLAEQKGDRMVAQLGLRTGF
jgi:predicted XRE-type DNA-binding protein